MNMPVIESLLYLETLGNGPTGAPIASSTPSSFDSISEDILSLEEDDFDVSNAVKLYLVLREVTVERNDTAKKPDNKAAKV